MATNIVQMTDGSGNKQYPVTSAEAVGMPDGSGNLQNYLNKRVTELNISVLYPTQGIGGTNKYDLATAIAQVPAEYRTIAGLKITFVSNETAKPETWVYNNGTFTDVNNWSQSNDSEKLDLIEADIENIDNVLQLSSQSYNGTFKNGYINTTGVVTSSSVYKYTEPIYLAAGTKIEIEGYCSGAAFLSKTDENGTSYTPIYNVEGNYNLLRYIYTASTDEYVCVSWKISVSIKIYAAGKNSIEQINDRLNAYDAEIDNISSIKSSIPYIKFQFLKQVGLSAGDGSIYTIKNRASTYFICSNIIQQILSINNDIEFKIFYYDRDNNFIKAEETFVQNSTIDNSFERFRILAKYKDDREITDASDIYNSIIIYESLNKKIDMLRIGGININGQSNDDNLRCSFKVINTLCKIEITSNDIDYAVRLFDDFGVLKYADEVWRHTPVIYAKNSAIQFRYTDDRVIDIDEVKDKIKITYINEPYIYDGTETLSLKCVSEKNYNDGTIGIIKGCVWVDSAFNIYLSDNLHSPKKYIHSWDFSSIQLPPDAYTMALLPDRTILGIYRTERNSSGANDGIRKNPIIIRPSNNIYQLHVIDFGDKFKPSGWLQNCGFMYNWKDNFFMFSEYTRPSVTKACVWKVEGDYTVADNWKVVLERPLSGQLNSGFKHFHAVQYDPYTGIIYAASGDDDTAAAIYVSKDNGDTFELLHGPNEKECRLLNFAFTKDKIYWASDSGYAGKHFLFSIERGDDNVMNFDTLTELHEFEYIGGVATYGTVYIQSLDLLIFLDRADELSVRTIPIHGWDLTSNKYIKILDLPTYQYGGFRCEYIQLYPKGETICVGYIQTVVENANYRNNIAILGNVNGVNDVKNMCMRLGRKSDGGINITFDTL